MGLIWRRRSASVNSGGLTLNLEFLPGIFLIFVADSVLGVANPGDVAAINSLYVSLGSPVLPGWVASGGDPCGGAWQGVQCNNSNILSIILNGANLGGELGNNLDAFASIVAIDLSNNHVGGSIPSRLPTTMKSFFLSANQFTGSIPSSISSLTQLTAMSLNNNLLSGDLPDAFQSLAGLINLDLSNNNLSGLLPPSMGNLSSLTALHVQDNQLSGTLDVLEELPLRDLNIENNQFSGPIPQQLLSIPNFKKDGNPFISNTAPLPPPSSLTPPQSPFFSGGGPSSNSTASERTPATQAAGPSTTTVESKSSNKSSTKRIVWIVIAVVLSAVILALALALIIPVCLRRRDEDENDRITKRPDAGVYDGRRGNAQGNGSLVLPRSQTEKDPREAALKMPEENPKETRRVWAFPKLQNDPPSNVPKLDSLSKQEELETDMGDIEMYMPPPPPPPPPPAPSFKLAAVPPKPVERSPIPSPNNAIPPVSAKSFTIAALQQYTNSFSQENLIGSGMLGSVYRAELPNGKFLAVKKLDKQASDQQKDVEFLHLVNDIDKIRHANVVQLIGYCAEHGQRLLIFEYCSNGTLQDALHAEDEFKKKLSWNSRIRMALGAARALEYLHEVCQPPIVHRNLRSTNLLLDDDLSIHVSDCGLAPLISSGSVSQLSGHVLAAYGYGAPEFESGIYTIQSDVYSFGVVMLELLTGRKSYDRTKVRGEQFLVRWAVPQLHDIDALLRMVDPSMKGQYPNKLLSRFADIIFRCVQLDPEFRPPMSAVVQDLLDMIRMPEQLRRNS